ncbi:hypothetical protein AB0B66_10440 [Catellatospora sp. NPDC049111]|uniref:hypothetical protein n=1 Tax=Catellatospora sp. NPDC049111 TaxID=3155271 RepID=UPI003410BC6D
MTTPPLLIIIVGGERAADYADAASTFDEEQDAAYALEEAVGSVPPESWDRMKDAAEELAGKVVHVFTGAVRHEINEHATPAGRACLWSRARVDADTYPWEHGHCPDQCPGSAVHSADSR